MQSKIRVLFGRNLAVHHPLALIFDAVGCGSLGGGSERLLKLCAAGRQTPDVSARVVHRTCGSSLQSFILVRVDLEFWRIKGGFPCSVPPQARLRA